MGVVGPKQLLDYEGQSLLRRAVEVACGAGLEPVVVVLGADAERIGAAVSGMAAEIAENPDWQTGMGSSLKAGLARVREIDPAIDAVIVLLCDQPLVNSEDVRALIELHLRAGKPLIAAAYAETVGVPALIGKSYFDEVARLPGSAGAKQLFAKHAEAVGTVSMPNAVLDIDEPGDYERIARTIR
jgi:molybdenum cofactor cytidylyltransferase